jgi:hypothetical protein
MAVYLACNKNNRLVANTGAYTWNNHFETGATALALNDETGAATGHTLDYAATNGGVWATVTELNGLTLTGSAAWAGDDVNASKSAFIQDNTALHIKTISGLNNSNPHFVQAFCSRTDGRFTRMQVNGGAFQQLNNGNGAGGPNTSETLLFTGVFPIAGQITIAWGGVSDVGYLNALRYGEEAPVTDTTAPTFTTSPAVTATSETGHTIASTLNESGTLYGVRLASGATAPSSPQVVAGQNNTGAAALEAVSVAATAATSADLTFSTGAASTAFDYYIVAQDDEGTPNLQATPTLVSATTAAAAVPGIGQLTVQFEGVAINVADWHIITRLAADQSILYNQTGQSSNVSGNIAAFATTSGSVGDPVRVEGLSVADAYSFVIEQNLGNIA